MQLVFGRPVEVMHTIWEALMSAPAERTLAKVYHIERDDFLKMHDGADVVGLEVGGQLAGGMFFMNGQVHIGILPAYKARWARGLKPMLEHGFKLWGSPMTARVLIHNKEARDFVEGVGCVRREWVRGLYVEYEVHQERMRYERNH